MSLDTPLASYRRPSRPWRPSSRFVWLALLGAALVALPVLALFWTALSAQAAAIWPHLIVNVIPAALADTALLLLGVGLVCCFLGVGAAWLVTQYEFPGRAAFEWLLVLPLALPTYITAYIYVEFLGFQGPLQTAFRALTGYRSLREYWFPDPRNLAGAVFVMGIVLYPYVYLPVRALFGLQGASLVEAARTLGASRWPLFWRIALPMVRPALAAGLTLALLETLNDIGASEYLGVRTLTISIYTTWLNRNSLEGAAQIACIMLAVVVLLIAAEHKLRGGRRFALPVRQPRAVGRRPLSRRRALAATLGCALPILLGAALPIGFLLAEVVRRGQLWRIDGALLRQLGSALLLSGIASVLVVALGLGIVAARRHGREAWLPGLTRIASLGYALPGTVLALGLLVPLAGFDNAFAGAMKNWFGLNTGLVLIGSGAALVIAYLVRFLAIAISGVESGLSRVSPRLDDAARTLGSNAREVVRQVHWPLARSAIAAAALLVFVDCLKELPATLLLRPLDLDTLATIVYGHASRGVFEEGALAALLIVLTGLYPAIILARAGGTKPEIAGSSARSP